MLKIVFFSNFDDSRILALQILASCNQNDSVVQTESINSGALEVCELIMKEEKTKVKEAMMGLISCMIRGENLEAKRIFLRLNGLDLLVKILEDSASERLESKALTLLRDLLLYDDHLHLSFNDISAFSNTNNIKLDEKEFKKKKDEKGLGFDINEEYREKN